MSAMQADELDILHPKAYRGSCDAQAFDQADAKRHQQNERGAVLAR